MVREYPKPGIWGPANLIRMVAGLTLLSRVSFRGQEITAPRVRALLALLAADLRTGCSTARLIDRLWPDDQPENPTKALQILVSRVRGQFGADVIANTPTGYRLTLSDDQVDAEAVLRHAAACARRARDGDHQGALAEAQTGLSYWDGPPSSVDDTTPLSDLRSERASTYRSLVRGRALALARLGRFAEALDPLTEAAHTAPHDEEVRLELLRAQATVHGPAAALAGYADYQRDLRDELGADPGPALQQLHRELLAIGGPVTRHGLRHEPNPLLGRDGDAAAVAALVRSARVTSIVGPGGLGKTRLAHLVGRLAAQPVVHFVALAGVTRDADVVDEVANSLGVGEARRAPVPVPSGGPLAGVVAALGPGPALLVLDNCEQVIAGVADLVQTLVSTTADIHVLTTSRSPLGLSSESVYLLPQLDTQTATELFVQRARAARPDVELVPDAVADVVGHLDGLPLAIELAAARVRVMSVGEIRQRLTDRFALLRGGPRDAPERHRTLQAVVDWSWNQLDLVEQSAMAALSLFPAGFTAEAAQAVVGGDALSIVESLVDHSLLTAHDTTAGARFQMLETVREFSAARRDETAVDAFLAWARALGLHHEEGIFGPDPYSTVDVVRVEHDNLLQALRIAVERSDAPTVVAVSAALQGLWTLESNFGRMAWLADLTGYLLSHFRPGPEMVEATRTTLTITTIYLSMINGPRPARSLIALQRLGEAQPTTLVHAAGMVIQAAAADPTAIFALCDSDEPLVSAAANGVAGYLWENAGELERAERAARRMLDVFSDRGLPWLATVSRARIAELCLQLEKGEEALRQLEATLPVYDRLGSASDVVGLRWWLVLANLQRGAVAEAERWLDQTTAARTDDPGIFAYGLGVRAEISLVRGQIDEGLAYWRQAAQVAGASSDPIIRRLAPDIDPWTLEARAVALAAHAQHGRLDLVTEFAAELPRQLAAVLAEPVENPPPYLLEFPVCGAVLIALSYMDSAEERPAQPVARMVALAERFRYLRAFQPTMSTARARATALHADGPAYEKAVSSYAGLDRDSLRAAGLALLRERDNGQRMGSRA
jgi:predicted ATPase/DNA-binding SARP family transcriptional activator